MLYIANTRWIRHVSYPFFVPDIFHFVDGFPKGYTTQWMHNLFDTEGEDFALSYIRQFTDIRKDGIPDTVERMFTRNNNGRDLMSIIY